MMAAGLAPYKRGNNRMRWIKIALAAFVAMMCVFYALQNIVNLQAAYGFVAYVASMAEHAAYPAHFGPAITAAPVVWAMLWIIIGLETLAGLLAAKGAFDLFRARNGSADEFQAAKRYAIAGCGVAVLVWFGLFGAIAGAYFQMWQTEAGSNALHGSFWYSMQIGLAWLLIATRDE
jgi:predicted small integral membrane protein